MSYHRKHVETDSVPIEMPEIYKSDEKDAKTKTPPLNWFWFYKNIVLGFACLWGIFDIVVCVQMVLSLGYDVNYSFYIFICAFLFSAASLTANIYLLINLRKFKPLAYKINMIVLIANAVFVSIDYDYDYSQQYITSKFISSAIFAILNIIYFEKRRHLFIHDCDMSKRGKRTVLLSFVAAVLAMFVCFLYVANI